MTQIGLCSVTFREKTPSQIIKLAKASGLDTIEWAGDVHVPIGYLDVAQSVGQETRQAGLTVAAYGSYYYAGQGENFSPYIETALALETKRIRIWTNKMNRHKVVGAINDDHFQVVVSDIKQACRLAKQADSSIHLECHQGTYTDSIVSSLKLIQSVDEPNLYLYWQPLSYLSHLDRIAHIKSLGPYLTNCHVFHWDADYRRFPLEDGVSVWQDYIDAIQTYSPHQTDYLIEFVKYNDSKLFIRDAQTLRKLLSR